VPATRPAPSLWLEAPGIVSPEVAKMYEALNDVLVELRRDMNTITTTISAILIKSTTEEAAAAEIEHVMARVAPWPITTRR
jgi:hypothetical protein